MCICIYNYYTQQTGHHCQSCAWSTEQRRIFFPCPRLHLRVRSRKTGLAVPPRGNQLLLYTWARSDGYSRVFLLSPASCDGVHLHRQPLWGQFTTESPPAQCASFSYTHCWYSVCMYGHTYSKSKDQPGKVTHSARG